MQRKDCLPCLIHGGDPEDSPYLVTRNDIFGNPPNTIVFGKSKQDVLRKVLKEDYLLYKKDIDGCSVPVGGVFGVSLDEFIDSQLQIQEVLVTKLEEVPIFEEREQ